MTPFKLLAISISAAALLSACNYERGELVVYQTMSLRVSPVKTGKASDLFGRSARTKTLAPGRYPVTVSNFDERTGAVYLTDENGKVWEFAYPGASEFRDKDRVPAQRLKQPWDAQASHAVGQVQCQSLPATVRRLHVWIYALGTQTLIAEIERADHAWMSKPIPECLTELRYENTEPSTRREANLPSQVHFAK